ncbi:MAG TPA: iron-sulfur cluster assembly accessory protein [Thiohalobacter sp.]|nr:iron-sulfur cluster assembly accessory protein [Thiohalobacter sp.]
MSIQLTETAAERVRTMLEKRGEGIGLRLSTRKSGCSGFAYVVDYADEIGEDDNVFESHGVKVVVDSKSMPMLDGMRLDYVRQNALNEGFEFNNPNVKDSCGCGESFSV